MPDIDISWATEDYTIEQLIKEINQDRITIPIYQRGIVWDEKSKKELIRSIKRGYPFGALLFYEDDDREHRQIIDGLQRASTIIDYVKNPSKFLEDTEIDDGSISDLVDQMGIKGNKNAKKRQIKELIKDWVKKKFDEFETIASITTGFQYYNLYRFMRDEDESFKEHDDLIIDTLTPLLDKLIKSTTQILDKKIPVIIIKGDEKLLPDIFEKINTSGKQLTKYERFRATWTDHHVKIQQDKLQPIVDYVKDYYQNLLDQKNEIDLSDDEPIKQIEEGHLSFFDVCFGFGKLLQDKFPALFGKPKEPDKIEGFSFSLINACLGRRYQHLQSLNTHVREKFQDSNGDFEDEKFNHFLEKIIDSAEYVNKLLQKYSRFKLNAQKEENYDIIHQQLQMVSIVVAVFVKKHVNYQLNDEDEIVAVDLQLDQNRREWKEEKKKFKANIEKHYTIDIVDQKWRGTGDHKLDEIVHDPDLYFKNVSWEYFKQTLYRWFEKQKLEKNEYQRVSPPNNEDKIILKVIYLKILNADDQLGDQAFDIEHVIPKKRLRDKLQKHRGVLKLPIGSIANLALLPSGVNRKKKDKPIYDENLKSKIQNPETIARQYIFTEKSQFDFLEKDHKKADRLQADYFNFLNERFNSMLEKIHDNLFNRPQ